MADRPPDRSPEENESADEDGIVRQVLRSDDDTAVPVRDALRTVAVVAVVTLLLFGVSGLWTPLVAVESPSMVPNMERGDLVFVVDNERFVGNDSVEGTGVVPLERAEETGREKFGQPGDVIVFRPDGDRSATPIIHRAHFWVEEGENWIDAKADAEAVGGATCEQVRTCPAPHDGFVTKGDNNLRYDQLHNRFDEPISTVVKPEWITGKASIRVPWIGHVRLAFDSVGSRTVVAPPSASPSTAPTNPIPTSNSTPTSTADAAGPAVAGEPLCTPPWTASPCPGTQFDSSGTTTKPSRP